MYYCIAHQWYSTEKACPSCIPNTTIINKTKTMKPEEKINDELSNLAESLAKEVIELREENKVLREALAWISKVTNSPEIGIRCDKILKQTEQP